VVHRPGGGTRSGRRAETALTLRPTSLGARAARHARPALILGFAVVTAACSVYAPTPSPASNEVVRRYVATFTSPPSGPLDLARIAEEVDASIDAAGLAGETTVAPTRDGIEIRSTAGPNAIDVALEVTLGSGGRVRLLDAGEAGEAAIDGPIDPAWRPLLGGVWVDAATVAIERGADGRRAQVTARLAPDAQAVFGAWTESHIGSMLVVDLDGAVVAAPVIMNAIPGGELAVTTTGEEQAIRLAAALRAAGGLTFRLQGP